MSLKLQIYFSDFFQVSHETLDEYGAFDISLINDLPLFIDPFLLFNSKKAKYQQLHSDIIKYLSFLREKSVTKISEDLISSWYLFPEVRQNWFGYSEVGNTGRGLGAKFAKALNENLYTVFANFGEEKITKSSHLEKLSLIEDNVGRDNISDFTTNLIKGFLLSYTEKFAVENIDPSLRENFVVNKVIFNYETETWERQTFNLPYYNGDYIILTPKDILTRDETWISNQDFRNEKTFREIALALPNAQLRAQINNYLDRALKHKNKRDRVAELKIAVSTLAKKYPELMDYYIRIKEDRQEEATSSSMKKVEQTENLFIENATNLANSLLENTDFYSQGVYLNTYDETYDRILYLKDVIENKGGHKVFYVNGKPIRKESDIHILFRLVWYATPSDVTSEANDGRGPVDFKISRGSKDKTLVEFKLANNSQLKRNLENQLEIYQKASDAKYGFKVIIFFTIEEYQKVQSVLHDIGVKDRKNIILIDARRDNKPSGSKA